MIRCPSCQAGLNVSMTGAPKAIRCPKCAATIKINPPAAKTSTGGAGIQAKPGAPKPAPAATQAMPKRRAPAAPEKKGLSSGLKLALILGVAGMALLFCVGGVGAVGIWMLYRSKPTPDAQMAAVTSSPSQWPQDKPASIPQPNVPPPVPQPARPPEPAQPTIKAPPADAIFVDFPERDEGGLQLAGVEPDAGPVDQVKDVKVYVPKNQRFTINMPVGAATRESTRILRLRTVRIPIEAAESAMKDGTVFKAGSIGIPANVIKGIPLEERLHLVRDMIVTETGGKVVEEKDISQGDIPGKDIMIEGPRGSARLRAYQLGGFSLFAVVESSNKARLRLGDANAYFESFKLAPANKP